jgi:hypothetical protein
MAPISRRVVPEAVELFHRLLAIESQGLHEIPEMRGGRMNEWNRAQYRLCDLMRCDRWQGSPIDCGSPMPPPWIAASEHKSKKWAAGYKARLQLERASRKL